MKGPDPSLPIMLWTVLSWVIVIVAAAGVLRIVLKPPFRRDLQALPALRAWLLTGGVIGIVVGSWLLATIPLLLHVTAVVSVAVMAFLWWRSQPSYGRASGWPPGSLGINASIDAIDNRNYYLEQAALHGPVFKMSQFGRPVLCVVGLSRGRALLQENKDALIGASLSYNRFVQRGILRYQPRATHKVEGPLFRRAFGGLQFDAVEEFARETCRARLRAFARSEPDGADVRPVVRSWTLENMARLFFGITANDPRFNVLAEATRLMQLDRSGGRAWRNAMQAALASAATALNEIAAAHLAHGDRTSILGSLVNDAPDTIGDEGRLRNTFFMFRLGVTDLGGALEWMVYQLSANHEWQPKLRNAGRTNGAPRSGQPLDLGTRVAFETLRLEQSEFIYRRVEKPFEFEGFRIPAGWIVRACVQESHRDPAIFPNPNAFDPDRFLGRPMSRSEYATFGLDEHGCMGSDMVYFFGRILVEELCAEFDWRITADSPFEHGTRHRHHWRPGREWRIALRPIATQSS